MVCYFFFPHVQRDLLAMLIAPAEVIEGNVTSTVYELLGKDDSLLKAVEE